MSKEEWKKILIDEWKEENIPKGNTLFTENEFDVEFEEKDGISILNLFRNEYHYDLTLIESIKKQFDSETIKLIYLYKSVSKKGINLEARFLVNGFLYSFSLLENKRVNKVFFNCQHVFKMKTMNKYQKVDDLTDEMKNLTLQLVPFFEEYVNNTLKYKIKFVLREAEIVYLFNLLLLLFEKKEDHTPLLNQPLIAIEIATKFLNIKGILTVDDFIKMDRSNLSELTPFSIDYITDIVKKKNKLNKHLKLKL